MKYERSTDTCPIGSMALRADSTDSTIMACVKTCTPFAMGACNEAMACFPADQTGATGVCLPEDCSADSQCVSTSCTASDSSNCGTGQTCTNINSSTGYGTCHTADKCTQNSDCGVGTCNNGECAPNYCDGALGLCLKAQACMNGATDLCASQIAGTTCDAATGRCVRTCHDDTNCGANAVCDTTAATHICVGRCNEYNEGDVCGTGKVCDLSTGRCAAKCSGDSCGADAICQTSGRCVRKCTAAVDPTTCPAGTACDAATGACKARCTALNETTTCTADEVCQTSTGRCLPACQTNPSECGAEACSANTGRCGQDCLNTSFACGLAVDRARLTCQGTPSPGKCTPVACSATTACANTNDYCDTTKGYCVVKCGGNTDCATGLTCNSANGHCE
jgi:hypothetical protein